MDLPAEVKRRPYCTDIVDLPHSMATMDHLEPIMYRSNFRDNPQMGERGLRKVRGQEKGGGAERESFRGQ